MIRIGDRAPKYARFELRTSSAAAPTATRLVARVRRSDGTIAEWELTSVIAVAGSVSGLRVFAPDGTDFPVGGRYDLRLFALDAGGVWIDDHEGSFEVDATSTGWIGT